MPLKPLVRFGGAIGVFVGRAYWTAGRRKGKIKIVGGMRDETIILRLNDRAPELSTDAVAGRVGGNEIGKHEAGRYTGKHETGRHTGSIFWIPWHFIVRNLPRFPDGV